MKTNIYITVDTETSIGGAFSNPLLKPVGKEKRIYGKIAGEHYGIPLIMDIADSYGLKITFFVEVLNHYYFGKEDNYEVCQYILKRGHDVQLHLHPNYLNFKLDEPQKLIYSDNMYDYDLETQTQLIKEGKELLKEFGVNNPLAFRAGNYGADINTLKALKKNDIKIDSSYNLSIPHKYIKITKRKINDSDEIKGVFEFPITCFKIKFLNQEYIKPLDINGVSFSEIRKTIESLSENKVNNIVIILHSFSFINNYDLQYNNLKIRKRIIKRFERVCEFISGNEKIDNLTFSETKSLGNKNNIKGAGDLPRLSPLYRLEHYLNCFFED